ncbi:MAG: hypothetical protein ACI4RU_01585 [Acutalibacteraceae bacterium]
MLGKLIKHEFIQTSKSLIAVYAAAGAAIAVLLVSYITKITLIGVTASFALVIIGFAAIIMTLVMVIKNFNDSLYGAQGYLTFTLPVKSGDILFSKFLVSFTWIVAGYAVMLLTWVIVFLFARAKSDGMLETITGMLQSFEAIGSLPTTKLVIEYAAIILAGYGVTVISYVSFVFFAVTAANTKRFQHKPLFYGIIFFFIIYIINKVASTVLSYKLPLSISVFADKVSLTFSAMTEGVDGSLVTTGIGGKIFTVLFAAALLFVTGRIMEKKVNVK